MWKDVYLFKKKNKTLFLDDSGEYVAPVTKEPPAPFTTPLADCGPTAGGTQCLNGGECLHIDGRYRCYCPNDATGVRCETCK